ncbi:MAG: UDP-N-acetylmuramoyl-tripeptide--D-alanyl-D-alanine ligase [Verrucomicrobiales bacterium]
MRTVPLSSVARWVDGALIQGTPAAEVSAVSTDSRKAGPGDLFVALKGDRFDAHDFLGQVSENGASALLVSSLATETESFAGGLIRVKDTLAALQRLAFHHRRNSPGLFVVGVTGSNGKTSTKDFLGAVLSRAGKVNVTAGNLNNHIGLPLTILSGTEEDCFGVWEMGMNHAGEIEVLAEIAGPDAAVLTNVGTAHIEHLGSRENIAREKSALASALPANGFCAMPVSDDYYGYVEERCAGEMVPVGIGEGLVQARELAADSDGRMRFELASEFGGAEPVRLPVRGRHMVLNALLAAAVGLRRGIEAKAVAEALSGAELTGGRLQERTINGVSVLDDSYNANPDSMEAALLTLRDADVAGRRVAVLGFMGELGDYEEREHLALGERAVENAVDALITVGERAAVINRSADGLDVNRNFATHEEAAAFLKDYLNPGDLVLVKGSRAAGMEKVIEGIG